MSTFEESLNDQDPDYVSAASNNQVQQQIYEENARNSTARKIIAIVEKEFSREIELKQKEILQIQERLQKSLKTLHFLRYVIITDFYNRKQCQLPQAAEARKQTRVHPAVKSLLGKSPKFFDCADDAVPSTSTDPRFLPIDECPSSAARDPTIKEENGDKYESSTSEKRTLSADEESRPRKIPRYVPPKSSEPDSNACPSRGERHKVRKRIIVGNISKWIPPDWRDGSDASHKWTMYVRGDKDAADISTYVSKVRFFLHPSYRPHDVVEITSYPFHLSRRGWGEFPLRVQLHFKNALNKPMDIIHHLKLDRTYTGLQTLGSETLVDLWIHTTNFCGRDENVDESAKSPTRVKIEPLSDDESLEKHARSSTSSRLTVDVSEKVQVMEMLYPPANSTIVGVSADVEERTVSEATSSAPLFSFDQSYLEVMRCNINHDHNYVSEQYSKPRCVVRDGNVTIEHFPDNETAVATGSLVEEKRLDDATVTSYKYNGDIQSSSDRQLSTVVSTKDTVESESKVVWMPSGTFQKNDDPKKRLLDAKKPSQPTSSQNGEVSSVISEDSKGVPTTITNGFCKPSSSMLDRLNNLQKVASINNNNSHLKPLEISIPPLFAPPSTSKHMLFVKAKKLISVDVATRKITDDNVKLSTETIPQGVSILKKPLVSNVKAKSAKNTVASKGAAVLTVKSAKSLLLNANYTEPALKIAESRDLYNCGPSDAIRGMSSSSSSSFGGREGTKSSDKEEKTTQRTKITLGKDKYRLQSKAELYETILRSIDHANITDTEALVRFIIRRLPIITQDARDPEYRRLHPYACSSEKDFLALSVGKQRALEWHRAKTIKYYLWKKLPQDDNRLWTIKEILIWARLHGYTPLSSGCRISKIDAMNSSAKKLPDSSASNALASTCTEPLELYKWLQSCQQESSYRLMNDRVDGAGEMEIDIVTIDEDPCKGTIDRRRTERGHRDSTVAASTLTPLELDDNLMPLHKFVCDTAQEIGIKIAPEEVVPGVVYCAASRAIMRVVECFVEDLTRSSLARAWERNISDGRPKIITLDDVRSALASREEFDILTNEGLGSQQQLSTSN